MGTATGSYVGDSRTFTQVVHQRTAVARNQSGAWFSNYLKAFLGDFQTALRDFSASHTTDFETCVGDSPDAATYASCTSHYVSGDYDTFLDTDQAKAVKIIQSRLASMLYDR